MQLDVLLSYEEAKDYNFNNKIAVAIDTLRATSTIVSALKQGIEAIYPVKSIKRAKKMAKKKQCLLLGERNGVIINGFDFDNSPIFASNEKLSGRELILTTTNGTRLFNNIKGAEKIYTASLLNLKAITDYLSGEKVDIVFCCAGRQGGFALDDFVTAGAIIEELAVENKILTDKALGAKELYLAKKSSLSEFIKKTASAKLLIKLAKKKDVNFILSQQFDLIPYYLKEEEKIKLI